MRTNKNLLPKQFVKKFEYGIILKRIDNIV